MPKKTQEKIPFRELPPKKQLAVANPELSPEQQKKLLKLMQFFDDYGIDYEQFTPESVAKKSAYPNYDQYQFIAPQRDLQKWLKAVHSIQTTENAGWSRVDSIRKATAGWPVTETFDFLNWMKFYQEGTHLKYKTAQLWYENGQPGYFLHIKPDAPQQPEPVVDGHAVDDVRESAERQEEKKRIIEKQRQKIIGRLDSAEKLLRSPEGQLFAGPELEQLMEAIYTLKKKVQLVNKLSTSTRLYEDMIVREGNVLSRKGFVKSAGVLYAVAQGDADDIFYSIAQANNPPPPGTGKPGPMNVAPAVPPPDDPSGAGHPGLPGTLPSEGPGMPVGQKSPPSISENQPVDPKSPQGPQPTAGMNPPSVVPDEDAVTSEGLKEFLEKTETGGKTDHEELAVEDTLEVEDHDTLEVGDAVAWSNIPEEIIRSAQMAPPAIPPAAEEDVPLTTTPAPAPRVSKAPAPKANEPIEVTDDTPPANEMGDEEAPAPAKDFDRIIDSALANVTVADVVAKLEDIAKIFKTREIPRQLSLVDMMLDSLDLASYFPTLSEAINKSLESNNYVSTRLEDIISRLRGAMSSKQVDLKGDNNQPRAGGVASALKAQQEKEDNRKKMRKEQESAELEGGAGKETPEVEIGEDLGAPAGPAPRRPPAV